jgi:hypothetical protein
VINPINGIRLPGLRCGSSRGSTLLLLKQVEGDEFDRLEIKNEEMVAELTSVGRSP